LISSQANISVSEFKPPPLYVFVDYMAITDEKEMQTLIMLCLDAESDETEMFYGQDCTNDMFVHLDELTITEEGDVRDIIVVFHNFKGYDGMFVLQYVFTTHQEVNKQINEGIFSTR